MVTDELDLQRHRKTCLTCQQGRYCTQRRTLEDLEWITEQKRLGVWAWDDNGKFIPREKRGQR